MFIPRKLTKMMPGGVKVNLAEKIIFSGIVTKGASRIHSAKSTDCINVAR